MMRVSYVLHALPEHVCIEALAQFAVDIDNIHVASARVADDGAAEVAGRAVLRDVDA